MKDVNKLAQTNYTNLQSVFKAFIAKVITFAL